MNSLWNKSVIALGVVGTAIVLSFTSVTASAAIANCADVLPDVTGSVTPNTGCQVLTGAVNDNNTTVQGLFGLTDWTQLNKVNDPGGSDGALTITGNLISGSWAVDASVFSTYESVMLVFKDGTFALPSNIVAYFIEDLGGLYSSPLFKIDGITQKDISHISLYVSDSERPDMDVIPIPAAAWLFGSAILGLLAVARRKQA